MLDGALTTDINELVKESQKRIKRSLVEGFEYEHLAISKSDKFLREQNRKKLDFAVMYVDLVASTVIGIDLTPDFLSHLIMVFSQEISYVIEHFNGMVLKFMGDAAIGYFPNSQNANHVVCCGIEIIHVVLDAINPLLLQTGHNGIHVKVTADYGQHNVVRYGSDKQKSHIDIISTTMNIAAKMQSIAIKDQIVIGLNLYEMLSERYKHAFQKMSIGNSEWKYHLPKEHEPYQVFSTSKANAS